MVTGWAQRANGERHVISWNPGHGVQDLGSFGGPTAQGNGARNAYIAGQADTPNTSRAVLSFQGGSIQDLGDLGGGFAWATDVNEGGDAVGGSMIAGGFSRAVLWTAGTIVDLGTLGGDHSYSVAIADSGQVIGISYNKLGELRGFSWTPKAGMIELDTLGGDRSEAFAVNEDGIVAGSARDANGNDHAVIWVPDIN
jgi:probable HAF family extracellular repeat protein